MMTERSIIIQNCLVTSSHSLANYVAKSFAIMDLVEPSIRNSELPEKQAAEHILQLNECAKIIVCSGHIKWGEKFANRIVVNIFFNINKQKKTLDSVRQNVLKEFKQRQVEEIQKTMSS